MTRLNTAIGIILVTFSLHAAASNQQPQTLGLSEVGSGSLLFKTAAPGRFLAAPTQETEVRISVRGFVAETVVKQRFYNPGDDWLEGVYVFPLPTRAAVHAMQLVVGDTIIVGQIRERSAAKKVYQKAKKAGKKASLVEQERPNIFTTSVANIGPGDEVEVILEYQESLTYDSGRYELRFPMVVGPRYIPGSPVGGSPGSGVFADTDQVPDASRITPPLIHADHGPINPITLAVELDAGFPLQRLDCTSHTTRISSTPTGVHHVILDQTPANRDFVLEWVPARGTEPKAAVFTEIVDGEAYVLAMVMPPADLATPTTRLPREAVFVIDTSGSMGGASIRQAREALLFALKQLKPVDCFNVIEFNSDHRSLFPSSRAAIPSAIEEAEAWVRRLDAGGGTELMSALDSALHDAERLTPLRQIIFITDACVGNEDALFRTIQRDLGRSRLFTVGIGSAPNSYFMERAAAFGRGSFTHIGRSVDVAVRMRELFAKIENPILANLDMRWPDPAADTWPRRLPDLYTGEPVVVVSRLAAASGDLEISGVRQHKEWEVSVPIEAGTTRAGVNRLWARRRIADLMDRRARGIEEEIVREQVLEVALAHHLVSKYTSLVAVDLTPSRPAGADLKSGAVRTNLPAGWQIDKVMGHLPVGGTAGRLRVLMALVAITIGLVGYGLRRVLG